jgi:hypothetical protein
MKSRQQKQEEAQAAAAAAAAAAVVEKPQLEIKPELTETSSRPIEFFIGPMSKNVVDATMEFCEEEGHSMGLIPSRRQVEWNGGYANNWTTKEFAEYARKVFLVRDHAGPGQGYFMDDGFNSLDHDCKYFDAIHIDPWKNYPKYEEGLKWTIDMIEFCHQRNSEVFFEVGTEESIKNFSPEELRKLVSGLSKGLSSSAFSQIKYLVVQSGTALQANFNVGAYDEDRLAEMIEVCKNSGMLSKEHNGDYLPIELIRDKFKLGLNSINIAPEFGQIETQIYLNKIKEEKPELLEIFYNICYLSKRWKKWVPEEYSPRNQPEQLINICGHYVLSNRDFVSKIKSHFGGVDREVKEAVKEKLKQLVE